MDEMSVDLLYDVGFDFDEKTGSYVYPMKLVGRFQTRKTIKVLRNVRCRICFKRRHQWQMLQALLLNVTKDLLMRMISVRNGTACVQRAWGEETIKRMLGGEHTGLLLSALTPIR